MGLAQQIAYSSLLAFFPAVIFLVGMLDLIGAYDSLQSFLNPVAPKSVTDIINQLQQDSGGGGTVAAIFLGALGAVWAASGAVGPLRLGWQASPQPICRRIIASPRCAMRTQ